MFHGYDPFTAGYKRLNCFVRDGDVVMMNMGAAVLPDQFSACTTYEPAERFIDKGINTIDIKANDEITLSFNQSAVAHFALFERLFGLFAFGHIAYQK